MRKWKVPVYTPDEVVVPVERSKPVERKESPIIGYTEKIIIISGVINAQID